MHYFAVLQQHTSDVTRSDSPGGFKIVIHAADNVAVLGSDSAGPFSRLVTSSTNLSICNVRRWSLSSKPAGLCVTAAAVGSSAAFYSFQSSCSSHSIIDARGMSFISCMDLDRRGYRIPWINWLRINISRCSVPS